MSTPGRTHRLIALSVLLSGWLACSGSSPGTGGSGTAGTGSQGTGSAGSGNGNGTTGAAGTGAGQAGVTGAAGQTSGAGGGTAGTTGAAGVVGTAGAGAAGTTGSAGTGAAGTTGVAGTTGAAGAGTGGSGADACGTPPWRALKITAPPALYAHGSGNSGAAVDTRAKSLGKIAVDLGVSGANYPSWLVKRGYHAMGSTFGACDAPNLGAGRDTVGNCRITQEWGAVKASVVSRVKALAASSPAEDWGYFLTQDGTDVRWSDVAFLGVSHGATTAAIIARIGVCVWRAVSSAGPRDNTCGKGPFTLPYDAAKPPFDPACPDSKIASWLDMPSKTPMDRFYVIDGVGDGEYGDIMFNVERTKYPGKPVRFDVDGAVLTGTNRFISMDGGHLDFVNTAEIAKPLNTDAVLNVVFAIPVANQNPAF